MSNISCYHNCTTAPLDPVTHGSLVAGIVISLIIVIVLAVMCYMFLDKKRVCQITNIIGNTLTRRRNQHESQVRQNTSCDPDVPYSTVSVSLPSNKKQSAKILSDNCNQIDNEGFSAFDDEIT